MYAQGNEPGLGLAPAVIGAGVSVVSKLTKSLFGGRSGEEIAQGIAKRYVEGAVKAARGGDTDAGPWTGARAGILPPYTMTHDANYYYPHDGYKDYQFYKGQVANPVTNPVTLPFFKDGYYTLYTEGLAPAPPSAGVSVSSGYGSATAKAGVNPLMIGAAVLSAVMLASLFKR